MAPSAKIDEQVGVTSAEATIRLNPLAGIMGGDATVVFTTQKTSMSKLLLVSKAIAGRSRQLFKLILANAWNVALIPNKR
jgi:hypothetical protein